MSYLMRIWPLLMSHLSSADSDRLWALGVQLQRLQPRGVHPSNPQGHVACTLRGKGLEMTPPLAMVCLVEGVIGHS